MSMNLPLEAIASVLQKLQGFFTFSTGGDEYVVVRKDYFDQLRVGGAEQQLTLPVTPSALEPPAYLEQHDGEEESEDWVPEPEVDSSAAIADSEDDLGLHQHTALDDMQFNLPADMGGIKIRFEPLRGDLPPDLQD